MQHPYRSRAQRRYNSAVKKAAARQQLKQGSLESRNPDPNLEKQVARRYNNLCDCSCFRCGGAQKYHKKLWQNSLLMN